MHGATGLRKNTPAYRIIAADPAMKALLDEAQRLAPYPVPALITGESGSGKEVLARRMHHWSGRGAGPFVPVNSAAIQESLFESVVFGHARGSFTGAVRRSGGLIESASGGTLFLDEIGEMGLSQQAKLLRFLDSGEYLPVGEGRPRRSDVRVVAATNRDIAEDARRGSFRTDLYYRLASVVLRIPPLRERPGDILPLAREFLRRAEEDFGLGPFRLSGGAERLMESCSWPGNARQLCGEMTAAALRKGSGRIDVCDLSPRLAGSGVEYGQGPRTLDEKIMALEREELLGALERARSNCTLAAGMLGLKRTTFLYRLRRHGIVLRERRE